MKAFYAKLGHGSEVNSLCTWCGGIFVKIYSSVQLLNRLQTFKYSVKLFSRNSRLILQNFQKKKKKKNIHYFYKTKL